MAPRASTRSGTENTDYTHTHHIGGSGEKEKGCPTMIGDSDLGQGMVICKKPPLSYGQRQAAAMPLRAACSD